MAGAERTVDDIRVSAARCPFCHEEVQRGVEPAVCVACHALHHTECMAEHGACSACGASHPRFAPVVRPVVTARPVAHPGRFTLPRLAGRAIGLLVHRRFMLVSFSLVAVAALVVALSARHPQSILLGLVALGGSVVGAAGTAFVDARRGLGAALMATAPAVALVLERLQSGYMPGGPSGLAIAVAMVIVGAPLVFWPASEAKGR